MSRLKWVPAEETRIEAVGCALHPFERNRYFYGKLLTVRDFETDQRYMIGKDHLINRHVHGSGIVCGLELREIHREDGNLFVDLTEGVALDCCGHEIVVSKAVNRVPARGTPQDGRNYVYLCYAECVKEPVPALANASTCEEVCCYNRIQETYEVRISPEPPVRTDAAFGGTVRHRTLADARAPLVGVRIEALQNGMVRAATFTDACGNYTLGVVAGTYAVRASATGYKSVTEDNSSVAAGDPPRQIDFLLEPATDRPDVATLCQDITQRYYEEHLRVCPQCADPKVLLAVVNLPPGGGQPSVDSEATRRHRLIVYSNPMLHELLCDHVSDLHNPHETTAADVRALQSINGVGNVEGGDHVSNVDLISSNDTIQITPHPNTQRIDITTKATPATTTVTSVSHASQVGTSLEYARADHVHRLQINDRGPDANGVFHLSPGANVSITEGTRPNELVISATGGGIDVSGGRVFFLEMGGSGETRESPLIDHGLPTEHIAIVMALEFEAEEAVDRNGFRVIGDTHAFLNPPQESPLMWALQSNAMPGQFKIILQDRRQFGDPVPTVDLVVRWWAIPKTLLDQRDVRVSRDNQGSIPDDLLVGHIAMRPGMTIPELATVLGRESEEIRRLLQPLAAAGRIRIDGERLFPA